MEKTISLTENRRFRTLYQRGKSCAAKSVAVYVLKNRLKAQNQLGITVSSKLGGAVVRNRLRRRLKEAYRLNEHRVKPGYDIVLVARHGSASVPFTYLERDLTDCLFRLGLEQEQSD